MTLKSSVIVKFHELALKGKNRPMFIRALANNLRKSSQGTGVKRVRIDHLMIVLELGTEMNWPLLHERVQNCLGVAKYYRAYQVKPEITETKILLSNLLKTYSFKSFRITTKRANKQFHMTSHEINCEMGSYVQKLTQAKVNLSNPDLEIFIDILHKEIMIHFSETRGYGALPVGVSGKVMTLLSGGIDSPVAAWHMMKRGCNVCFLHFHSHPIVDTSSIEKSSELTQILTSFQYKSTLLLVPFGEIQKHIIVSTPPPYRIILYRRFMIRIAEQLAKTQSSMALVTGESLGQVSSQTLENITVIDEASNMPILRPLIGFNKDEIINVAQQIGTYQTSILPDQDCCTLFVPKHPVTRSKLAMIYRLEKLLPIEDLVNKTLENIQVKDFSFPTKSLSTN